MTTILTNIYNSQKQIWSDPNKRQEIFNNCAVAALTSYAAEQLFKFGNETLKAIPIIGFMCIPLMSPEKRVATVMMTASLFFYENVLHKSKVPSFAIHTAVVLGTYLYCSTFQQAQETK